MREILFRKFIFQLEYGDMLGADATMEKFTAINQVVLQTPGGQVDAVESDPKQKIDAILDITKINRIMSLGGHCDIANYMKKKGITTYSLFDWVMSPYESVIKIVSEDGARLLNNPLIDKSKRVTGYPVCTDYNIVCLHDFPRDANGSPLVNDGTVRKAKAILKYKLSTMKQYCAEGGAILFLRWMLSDSIIYQEYGDHDIAVGRINALAEVIEEKFEIKDFTVIVFYGGGDFPQLKQAEGLDKRLILVDVNDGFDYQVLIDYYVETHKDKVGNPEAPDEATMDLGEGKYRLFEYYRNPPLNFEIISDALVAGLIQEWNLQRVVAAFFRKWLDRHGDDQPQAKMAYYQMGSAYMAAHDFEEAAQTFLKGLELSLHAP